MFRVNIPSKGRAGKSKFLASHEDFYVYVEPQEFNQYFFEYPQHTIIEIPKNNMGARYVRQFIIDHMRNIDMCRYWMIDDDITGFFMREGTRLIKTPMHIIIHLAENQFAEANTNLGSLEYRQHSWCAKQDLVLGLCAVCVYFDCIDNINYRDVGYTGNDRDFSMQCVRAGLNVHRSTIYAFDCPGSGVNSGGMQEGHLDKKLNEESADKLISLWGEHICKKYLNSRGLYGVKVNWKAINSKQQKIIF